MCVVYHIKKIHTLLFRVKGREDERAQKTAYSGERAERGKMSGGSVELFILYDE